VLGERMADRLAHLGVAGDRIRIIANWADGRAIAPVRHSANALRTDWQLGDAFVVGYSGNLGRAHEIETLLEAIAILERPRKGATLVDEPRILWLFIGSGALFGPLRAEVARRGLASVRFKPYQQSERLAESLSAADVHLVLLRPELEGLIVPSKVYGICAAGRPTIFVGDGDGEIARLVDRHRCGRTVAVGDGAGLAQAVVALAADPAGCRHMGERARRAFEAEFDMAIAVARWEQLLLEVSGAPRSSAQRDVERAPEPALSARNAR
jgi:glycosyltransferase involved in cell wall biosynthesis